LEDLLKKPSGAHPKDPTDAYRIAGTFLSANKKKELKIGKGEPRGREHLKKAMHFHRMADFNR